MNASNAIADKVHSVSFSFLSSADIRTLSVLQITNPVLFDNTGRASKGGLYDPHLGPSAKSDLCAECRLNFFDCAGHYGHIELASTVFHPLFLHNMFSLLKGVCFYCHRLKSSKVQQAQFVAKLTLLNAGLLDEAERVSLLRKRGSEKSKKNAFSKKSAAKSRQNDGSQEEDEKNEDDENSLSDNSVDSDEESFEEYEARLQAWVGISLMRQAKASPRATTSNKDQYKNTLVFEARRQLIKAFLSENSACKKCQSCSGISFTLRKEGYTKVIELSHLEKQKLHMDMLGLKRPQVLSSIPRATAKFEYEIEQIRNDGLSGSEAEQDDRVSSVNSESSEDEEGVDILNEEGDVINQEESKIQLKSVKSHGRAKRMERVMIPDEAREHLRKAFKTTPVLLSLLYARHGPFATETSDADMFFLDVLPVTPTRFRPPASMGDQVFENPQNDLMAKVLNTSYRIRDLNNTLKAGAYSKEEQLMRAQSRANLPPLEFDMTKVFSQLLESLIQLQIDVNSFMDSNKNPTVMRQGKLPPAGIKQTLEKKDGLFRKHMMGKRVNHAARSVISPDVNIETDEIGVPPFIASTLTFPEPVTALNVHALRQLVINGPRKYPGASMVQYEDGSIESLDKKSLEQRTALANQLLTPSDSKRMTGDIVTKTPAINKKVYRHLKDGDMLLVNRQPTLHKPSMMAHKAKILKGEKTIRMHYANCKSYNADFDGDEMNMHFAQNCVAQAEMRGIANTSNQYLVPTSGDPLRGLIQDHVVAGVWMTCKNSFFTREEYFQLLYGSLRAENDPVNAGKVHTIRPAILKPKALWTGKQIISTILLNIAGKDSAGLNLTSKSKLSGEKWGADHAMEAEVIFMDGHLVQGVMDSKQFGNSAYGLVHSVFQIYGPDHAGRLLGVLSRLFSLFLSHRAFSCRMDDLIVTDLGNLERQSLFESVALDGELVALKNVGLEDNHNDRDNLTQNLKIRLEEVLRDDLKSAALDADFSGYASKLRSKVMQATLGNGRLIRDFPHNNMQLMTLSGAKGSDVNASQISSLLGQQQLEGRRVPFMVSGKTLPSFKAYETKPIAGGFIASRFLTGIKPQEYYFHCMAGREGLIDTAVKTSRSGYLQRCLIKHLEGIRVHYDQTVRDSDESVMQFMYGEDGLDVTRQKYLGKSTFEFVLRNYESLEKLYNPKSLMEKVDCDAAVAHMRKILKKKSKQTTLPTPTMDIFSPARYFGATSETFANDIEDYISKNSKNLLAVEKIGPNQTDKGFNARGRRAIKPPKFRALLRTMYAKSLADPGEAVGLVASQSVGEPSTQMTLNTFHFAGHGAANVTMGIPRLREIVMTASKKPMTPTISLVATEKQTLIEAKSWCAARSRLTLSQVVDNISVVESLTSKDLNNAFSRRKTYSVHIKFYPQKECQDEYHTDKREILESFIYFAAALNRHITLELRKAAKEFTGQSSSIGKGHTQRSAAKDLANALGTAHSDAESEGEENDDENDTAETAKGPSQKAQQGQYDDDGSDDDAEKDIEELEDYQEDLNTEDSPSVLPKAVKPSKKATNQIIYGKILALSQYIKQFEFDSEEGEWCKFEIEMHANAQKLLLVAILERCCRSTVIHEVSGISRFLANYQGPELQRKLLIQTEGSNLSAFWELAHTIGDLNKLRCNDIYAMLKTYGVEAARSAIIDEIHGVFSTYNIDVNYRHLTLISDYMTHEGGYKPFNRTGLTSNPSTFLKASFETTADFIANATLHGDFEDLKNPSARIVVGNPTDSGTGMFGVVTPISAH